MGTVSYFVATSLDGFIADMNDDVGWLFTDADYGYQAFEKIFHKSPKALRAVYQWAMPVFARRFLTYASKPVSRKEMLMNTASGVILVLEK